MTNNYDNLITDRQSLRFLYANIRSMVTPGKFDELKCVVESFKNRIHVIILTETWIKSDSEANRFQLSGYTHYYQYRQGAIGGGVSIFIHNTLKHYVIEELEKDENHYLWIHVDKFSIDIGAIYKPGRTDVTNFLETFSLQLHQRKRAVVFGDFNLDLLKPDYSVEAYKNSLQENGYTIINKICSEYCTRETSKTKTLLDHISTDLKENKFHFAIVESSMSDHKQIYFEIKKHQIKPKQRMEYEAVDYKKLYDTFKQLNLEHSINISYTSFEDKLIKSIQACKVTKVKIINSPKQEWINKEIIKEIDYKNILWEKHKRDPENKLAEEKFIKQRNLVANNIKKMKKDYYYKKFADYKTKPSKMWKLINNICNNKAKDTLTIPKLIIGDTLVTDTEEICENFNHFFSTIGAELAQKIPLQYHNDGILTVAGSNKIYKKLTAITPATVDEVIKIINDLDANTSSGIDNISTKSIKCLKTLIAPELTLCLNNCLDQGIFPASLKIAKVVPIYKSGKKTDPSNYRPISVLPIVSKIFEKVIYNRIETYINSIDFLYHKQYGFRPKSNTLSATVDLVTKIKNNIDDKKIAIGIFIDLKKAFDTVSHRILLNKLNDIGITEKALELLKSYLCDRYQIVKLSEHKSNPKLITYGVPQGSILGPLLFLIYINGVSTLGLKGDLSLYADDTSLFYFGHEVESLIQDAQSDLNILNKWFRSNLLTINVAKTNYMIFSAKNKKIPDFSPLKIDDMVINKANSEKYLGLELDNQLTWKVHLKKVKQKLISLTGLLRGIVRCLPRKVCYFIYNSLAKPHIDYLLEIWGSAAKSNLNTVQIAQNKLIKTLFHYDFLTPTVKIYKDTKIFNIQQSYKYYSCLLIRKILNKKIHTNITFTKKKSIQTKMLRSANNLILRPPRTNYGKRNITYESAQLYNKLPTVIKEAKSMLIFKRQLKNILQNNKI